MTVSPPVTVTSAKSQFCAKKPMPSTVIGAPIAQLTIVTRSPVIVTLPPLTAKSVIATSDAEMTTAAPSVCISASDSTLPLLSAPIS